MYLPPPKIQLKIPTPKITKNSQSITNPLQNSPEFYFDLLCTTQRGISLAPIHQQINLTLKQPVLPLMHLTAPKKHRITPL